MEAINWIEKLPEWARYNEEDSFVEVNPDEVYPLFLSMDKEALAATAAGLSKPEITKARLERARKTFTKILRDDIVPKGTKLWLRILKRENWKLVNYPGELGPNKPGEISLEGPE